MPVIPSRHRDHRFSAKRFTVLCRGIAGTMTANRARDQIAEEVCGDVTPDCGEDSASDLTRRRESDGHTAGEEQAAKNRRDDPPA